MFPLFSLVSLLPPGGKAFVARLQLDALRARVDALTGMPPEAAAVALRAQLVRTNSAANLHVRQQMLDIIAECTRQVAGAIEAELNQSHHPLSSGLQDKVVAVNDLLKLHAKCSSAVVDKLSGSWIGRGNPQPLRHALNQAMDMEHQRLMLAFRAYTPGTKSAWRNLHRLYRIARTGGHAGAGDDSPDHIYVKTLLLALAEPVRMAPGELDRIRLYLERHAGLARLSDAGRSLPDPAAREGCFLIRHNEDGPGRSLRKWHSIAIQSGDLLLDCGPLLKKMQAQADALAHGVLPRKIGLPNVARHPHYLTMLNNLLMLWSAPPSRRFPRQQFRPRVELAAGLDDLWALLSLPAGGGSAADDAAANAPELSEWSVANESPAGFALQYVSGESRNLSVGALVGLRFQDHGKVHVCLVRRLASGERRRTELGLQQYAPLAVPTTITWGGAKDKEPARAVVLPRVPSLDGAAAVIVAPGLLRPGKRVPFRLAGRNVTLLAEKPIERCAAYEIFTLGGNE